MGDYDLLKDFSPGGIMFQTFARQVNLEAQRQELLAKMSKPWHIDQNGLICVDEVMSEDEVERLMALGIPFTTSYGTLLPTYKTEDKLFALRIKRIKKHYKPKFTL